MRMLTTFYNDRQRKLVRRYIYLSHSKAYKEAKDKDIVALKNYEGTWLLAIWFGRILQSIRKVIMNYLRCLKKICSDGKNKF